MVSSIEQTTSSLWNSFDPELPRECVYKTFRCGDRVAILNLGKTGTEAQELFLWSLSAKSKIWTAELPLVASTVRTCTLSEDGLVLLHTSSKSSKIIFCDGNLTGNLPSHNWRSIIPIGKRLLGCWKEEETCNHSADEKLPNQSLLTQSKKLKYWFGEWDEQGELLYQLPLNNEVGMRNKRKSVGDYPDEVFFSNIPSTYTVGREAHVYACSDIFWIRLLSTNNKQLPSQLEIVHRANKSITTFSLPHTDSLFGERFTSACIFQNRLYYGKHLVVADSRLDAPGGGYTQMRQKDPSIGIFDLDRRESIGEFLTSLGEYNKSKPIKQLVANQYCVAWIECERGYDDAIKYLNIQNSTVHYVAKIPYSNNSIMNIIDQISLDLSGSVLSFNYPGIVSSPTKVIDMTNTDDERNYEPAKKVSFTSKTLDTTTLSLEQELLNPDLHSNPANLTAEDDRVAVDVEEGVEPETRVRKPSLLQAVLKLGRAACTAIFHLEIRNRLRAKFGNNDPHRNTRP